MNGRALPGLALVAMLFCGEAAGQAPTLERCKQEVAETPADFTAFRCFDRLSRVPGGRDAAVGHLEAVVDAESANAHARTMLARLLDPRELL